MPKRKSSKKDTKKSSEKVKVVNVTTSKQAEEISKKLKNGKPVIIHVTTFYRWGTFEIVLTEKQKEEIKKYNMVVVVKI